MKFTRSRSCCMLALLGLCLGNSDAVAHDPVTAAEIQRYKDEGTYDERIGRTLTLQQFKLSEGLRQRAIYKVHRAALQASGMSEAEAARALTSGPLKAFPFTAQPELKSSGTVKTVTILIDFKDKRAGNEVPGMTVDTIRQNIYGAGTTVAQAFAPYESVHSYYGRASQSKVDIQGNVLGWHSFPNNRATYQPARAPASLPPAQRRDQQARLDNAANFKMVSDAMDAFDPMHDFAQYDNDNDGDIDLVTILYAGDPEGWNSFWWAYRWEFFTPNALTKTFDGKRVKQFVFQFVSKRGTGGTDFNPTTLMHETGHAFGLADYYDYDADVGPQGGLGGLDMMDHNLGNQNAFSRWLLDWIKPSVIGSGAPATRELRASGSTDNTKKAIAIFPGLTSTLAPSQEMFMIENRHRIGNDKGLPADGLLIWHIDATVNDDGDDFSNNNSFSDRKLIRLVRADNAADFNDGDAANASTYFATNGGLTPSSSPNSNGYDGFVTNIVIDQISVLGELTKARIGIAGPPSPVPTSTPAAPPEPSERVPELAAADQAATVKSLAGAPVEQAVDLDQLESLDRAFSSATPKQLSEIWQQLENKAPAPGAAAVTLRLLLTRWAQKDGKAAVEALLATGIDQGFVRDCYPDVMQAWAMQAPTKAFEWYVDDANAKFRESPTLVAGSKFAHESFEHQFMIDASKAVASLGKLKHTSEVMGAVEGLRHAVELTDKDASYLNSAIGKLKKNSDVIKASMNYFDAIEAKDNALNAAALLIEDPIKRSKFRSRIEGKSRD